MIQLPKHLPVCGDRWSITTQADESDLYGEARLAAKDLMVNVACHRTQAQALSTLAHEAAHAVFASTGWNELLKGLGENAEEGLARCIEHHLWPVYRHLADWDKKREEK